MTRWQITLITACILCPVGEKAEAVQIDVPQGSICYEDADGDSFGNPSVPVSCIDEDSVDNDLDCNDDDDSFNPNALEIADDDAIDNNCDGEDFQCYRDADNDGFGDITMPLSCLDPEKAENSLDCDDGDDSINPEAFEVPEDGIDQNCDGVDPTLRVFDDGFETPSG